MTDKTAIEKARDALVLARDYINDGIMLPQDIDYLFFKTSDAIDEALAELNKSASKEAGPDNHATDEAWLVAAILSASDRLGEVIEELDKGR